MKQLLVIFAFAALAATGKPAAAGNLLGGDADAGKEKTTACAACHGADGNSIANPEWPTIAGQHAGYLYEQMKHFKQPQDDSVRYNALMYGQMQALSDDDMKNVAAWYAEQDIKPGVADPELAERGERIYLGGIAEDNIPACIACHGPSGNGNAAAKYPVLASQHAAYTVTQLKAYQSGERRSDANQVMRNITAEMDEDDMRAVAEYIQGLQP